MNSKLKDELQLNSGLQKQFFDSEFELLMNRHGVDPSRLSMDQLREILVDEIQNVLLELKELQMELSDGTNS